LAEGNNIECSVPFLLGWRYSTETETTPGTFQVMSEHGLKAPKRLAFANFLVVKKGSEILSKIARACPVARDRSTSTQSKPERTWPPPSAVRAHAKRISSNGKIPHGGRQYELSRALGPSASGGIDGIDCV